MRKRLTALFAVLAVVLIVTASTVAQTETGQILGTVTDPTGAAVPKAKVTVKNVGTGAGRTAMTEENGQYRLTNLLPALYDVIVEKEGFAKNVRRVQVTVGSKVAQDIQLSVGATTEVVEVTAEAGVAVNTETQTIATVIDSQKIVELPTLTRNPYDLAATAGNVTSASESGLTNRGVNLNINGLRAAGTNVLLDGAANNDEFVASVGQQIPLDAVQEFSILTTNYTAEYGRAGAGVVNVATKSGTNSLHGTAYEFGRYSKLAANSFDNNANNLPKSLFTRNQFGYSVGGPIKKDKLFFFQSTEWLRIRSSFNRVVTVPAADLINAAAPATRNFMTLGTLRSNFRPLRSYTRAQLSQDPCPSGGACAALPASANYFTQGSYTVPSDAGGGDPQNTYFLVGRIDLNISDKTLLYGRYAYNNAQRQIGVNTNSPYQGYDTASQDHDSNFLISLVHQASPRWTTQSKLVFNRLNNQQPLGANPVGPTLYMLSGTPQRILGDRLAFPGYSPFTPGNAVPFGGPQNFLQAYEDVSYAKGKHQFRFGGNYVYIRDNRTFGAYEEAVETLSLTTFATGINNFLTGQLDQFQAAVDPQGKFPCGATTTPQCSVTLPVGPPSFSRSNRYHEFGVYGQDSWKVAPRVTLNLGVRWEYFGVQHNKNPRLDSNYYDAVGGSVFQGIRSGDVAITPNSPVGGLWRKQYNNFAPRLGFAWDVFGNGKTSLRGGYGIAYERNFGNVTFNVIQNPPGYAVISILPRDIGAPIPITANNAGPLAGSGASKGLPPVSLRNVDSNIRTAYAHFWSLSVEREVGRNLFVGIDYSGSKGHGLYTLENPNRPGAGNVYLGDPVVPVPGPGCPSVTKPSCFSITRLRSTQYTNINRRGTNGFSLYNGANARVETRSLGTTGLTLRANYTYAHATDNLSSTFSESDNNFNLGLLDPFNPKLDRGPADFDVRHRVALSATWDLPFARNASSGVAKKVLGGWTVSPIFTARTGTPFTLFDCSGAISICPRAMTSGALPSAFGVDNVPSVSSGRPTPNSFDYISLPGSTFNQGYRNPILVNFSDFGPFPATMMSRNYFRTPGTWSVDVGIYKTTAISERFKLQVRGEMFNTFNHSNLWAVLGDNTLDDKGAALVHGKKGLRPDGTKENRNVQLAVKLIF